MPSVAIDGTQLHYLDRGTGPVLLLGHSYLWDHRMWAPQIERWAQRYRVIATDVWGHGGSGPPPAGADLDLLADHHAQLLRRLEVPRCAVIGLSVGGMWGLRLALDHPDMVAGLVVIGGAANAEPEASKARYDGLLRAVAAAGAIPPPVREQIVPGFFSPASLKDRPELAQALDTDLAAILAERIPGVVALGHLVFGRDDIVGQLPQLTVPTLIGVGADDVYRPVPEAELMATAMPNAHLTIWPDAGHIANLDQPDLVAAGIEAFLDRIGW